MPDTEHKIHKIVDCAGYAEASNAAYLAAKHGDGLGASDFVSGR